MKKFKTKKLNKKKKIVIFILLFLLLFIWISHFTLHNSHTKIIDLLTYNFKKNNDISFNFLTSNLDYLLTDYAFFEQKNIKNNNKPSIIYLYNTHDTEKYYDNTTIYEATKLFKNNLNRLGIEVIQEENKVGDYLNLGLSNYEICKSFLNDVENDNIAYYIDIHRDSVKDTKVTINNKNYAKILFVLGLENPNYLENKNIMVKMNEYLNTNYPGISKGIYEKKGKGVDGVYNQDFKENVLLIEIGGVDNNFEEINNSTEILSLMIYHMLGE